jgi:hypothetical protein
MTIVRLAPFLLLGVVLFGCGSAAPGGAPAAPAAADVEEVSFEISALM